MELVDAHCHFDFPEFDGRREEVLARARSHGVSRLVIPGVTRRHWERVVNTATSLPGLFYCLGIHPWFVEEHEQDDLGILEGRLALEDNRCVGLGECGLDRLRGELSQQFPWFEAQVDLAARLSCPLVIHSVRTHDEVHSVLKARGFLGKALVHGFSGSYQQARKLVDLGCFIGIGGVITHARAKKTRDTVSRLPLESLVLETDAPDMPPEGVAKGMNSPELLPEIFSALAFLRRESPEQLYEQLLANVSELYGWMQVSGVRE